MTCPNCLGSLVYWSDSTFGSYGNACLTCRLFVWAENAGTATETIHSKPLALAHFPTGHRNIPAYRSAVDWCGP